MSISVNTSTHSQFERRAFPRPAINIDHLPDGIILDETGYNRVEFNVMPDRPVSEELFVKQYKIFPRFIEAIFDRKYCSSMEKSPSHLIFLTSLVHCQKMIYAYFCHELNLPYDPSGKEVMKIWPTQVQVNMPSMITNEQDISHKMWFQNVSKGRKGRITFDFYSQINDTVEINGRILLLTL